MMNITKIKQIRTFLLFLLPAVTFLASCNRDGNGIALCGGEAEIEMAFIQPLTYASGDETSEEKAIKTLDLLVFQRPEGTSGNAAVDGALFVEKRYAWLKTGSTNKYNSIITIGERLDIYFVVNQRDLLDDLETELVAGTTTYAQAREKLVLSDPQNLGTNLSTKGLPMWGYMHNQTIADQTYTNLGIIRLLRAVASADITVSSANFTLEKGHVVFGANKGYLPFSPANLDASNNYNVVNPEIPAGMTTTVDWSYTGTTSTSPQAIDNKFYMYENDAPIVTGKRTTKLVIEGKYTGAGGSGNTTFYPLSFRTAADNNKLQVKRNWKYVLFVTKVNGDGYPTLETAKNGEDLNMEYVVIPWNGNQDDNIQVIGSKYIANYPSAVELYRPATSVKKFKMSSNFAIGDFVLELNNGGDFPDPDNKTEIQNARFNVKFAAGSSSETFEFTVTALQDYADGAADNPSVLKVTVGGIVWFEVIISQTNETPIDWFDGGNQDIQFGN
ncbi:MAG: hypothetical protein LBB62_01255 [Proteiniphilum sp.]|jgi:hypothetical protein|nr:hypothetical protein [Proteiniphilum sp.]